MGYKQFTPSTLTSTDVNSYLMNQSVMVFTNASARATAIPFPTEGMVTYLTDINSIWVYNGTGWVPVAGTAPRGTYTGAPVVNDYTAAVGAYEGRKLLWYKGSGTFVCTSAGFCDIIVVGGGGGGGSLGGGGGGGQVTEYKQVFLPTGTYTITIGAGGAGGTGGGRGSLGGDTSVVTPNPPDYFLYGGGGGGGGGQNAGTPGIYGQSAIGGGGGHSYSGVNTGSEMNYGHGFFATNGGYGHTGNPYKGGGGGGSRSSGLHASLYSGGDGGAGLSLDYLEGQLGVFGAGGGGSVHADYTGFSGRGGSNIYSGAGNGYGAGYAAVNGNGGGGGGGGYSGGTYYAGGRGGNGAVVFLGVNV